MGMHACVRACVCVCVCARAVCMCVQVCMCACVYRCAYRCVWVGGCIKDISLLIILFYILDIGDAARNMAEGVRPIGM